ncbi:MAG: GNAT family N-acetyltransferase, partial [Actinomycetota bacterium]|nr:GNAT family N-acetyltransferase [Actinomycetota bacterium]
LVEVEQPAGAATTPGRAFAEARGFRCALAEVRRDLDVPVPAERLDALEAACLPLAQGYDLRLWEERCPDDLVEDRALLARRMSTDAPMRDVPWEEEDWDADRVRTAERLLREQGRGRLAAGAVHRATGRLVAFTAMGVPLSCPERAYQWDTLVLREHRGHRLGTLVKLANLRRVAAAWPRTRVVSTWNAEENAPMIAVNEALGCRVVGTLGEWLRPVRGTRG